MNLQIHGLFSCASLLFEVGTDGIERPFLIGKLAGLQLGIDQVPVDRQLEAAAR